MSRTTKAQRAAEAEAYAGVDDREHVVRLTTEFRKLLALCPNDGDRTPPPPGILLHATGAPTFFPTRGQAEEAIRDTIAWRTATWGAQDGPECYEILTVGALRLELSTPRRLRKKAAAEGTEAADAGDTFRPREPDAEPEVDAPEPAPELLEGLL